jgi:hypothetical protein
MKDVFADFLSQLDAVEFTEQNLVLEGKPFMYSNNGRDFAKQIMRYAAHIMPHSKRAKPVIIVKGRQIGVSTLSAALSLYFMYAEKHKSFLHCFPEIAQARKFSTKRLIELIEDSQKKGNLPSNFLNLSSNATQSQVQKDFHNNNTLYVEGTSIDGRRLRGVSVSGLCIMDEFASLSEAAYRNVLECSANSHFGYINNGKHIPHIMFGTPEAEGSLFERLWMSSNKQEFFFTCPHCGLAISLFYDVKNRDFADTNLFEGTLVTCRNKDNRGCGKVFDKIKEMPKGVWKSTIDPTAEFDYVGFYIPQFLNGPITKETIDQKFKEYTTKQFFNEVLGKFYSFEDEVLNKADIIRFTTKNPSTLDWDFPPHVIDKQTFMGVDWGARVSGVEDTGSGSYTVVTILSVLPTGHLKLEHCERLSTNDMEQKITQVSNLMRRFNVHKCVADKGFGYDIGQRLQKMLGPDKFSMCEWGGHTKKPVVFDKDNNTIRADKHVSHEMFFDILKQGKFCFPFSLKAEQEIDWLLEHMTNIEVLNVDKSGVIKKEYRKKQGKETDGLASLIYAYTAFQFFKTKGFAMDGEAALGSRGTSGLQPYVVGKNLFSSLRGSGSENKNYSRHDRRRR